MSRNLIHLARRPRRGFHLRAWLAALGLLAFLLNSCAGTKGQREAERYYKRHPDLTTAAAELRAAQLKRDSLGKVASPPEKVASSAQKVASPPEKVASSAQKVASSPEKGSKPGIFSGIGHLFSTPEGRANRQAVRLAKAVAPKIGKKAQAVIQSGTGNTNTSTQATTAKKATAATGEAAKVAVAGKNSTQATDSAVAANTGGGAAALGAGAHAEGGATVTKPGFWSALLGSPVGQAGAGILLTAVVGAGVYGFVLWRKRKKNVESLIS